MEPIEMINTSCCPCQKEAKQQQPSTPQARRIVGALIALAAWVVLYQQLLPFSRFFTYEILGLTKDSHLGA